MQRLTWSQGDIEVGINPNNVMWIYADPSGGTNITFVNGDGIVVNEDLNTVLKSFETKMKYINS